MLRVVLAAVIVLRSFDALACSMSADPAATVLQPPSGAAPGHQPWIVLWNVKHAVEVTAVAASCATGTICKGTKVEIDRTGDYLRPRAALAASTRLQVTSDRRLLADVVVTADPARPLPAWNGVKWISAKQEPEALCSPAGPVVRLELAPTKDDLAGAQLLVYLNAPDPKHPESHVARIVNLGTERAITLTNSLAAPPWLTKVPAHLWFALSDGDGNIGPAISLP